MRAVVQRVASASVSIYGEVTGRIGQGLVLLVGVHKDDETPNAAQLVKKVVQCRIFNDAEGKMNLSVRDVEGAILAISNFTVYGDASTGRRPSFTGSKRFAEAERLFGAFVAMLKAEGFAVETGIFGADMQVSLVNDGPVTLIVDA